MSENQFKVGDVVVLKSGGPKMTVDSIATESDGFGSRGDLYCKWFEGTKVQHGTFTPATVELPQPVRTNIRVTR